MDNYKKTKYKYQEITDVVDFGFHRGKTVQEVIDKEEEYFEWCAGNMGKKFKLSKKVIKYFEEKWNRPFKPKTPYKEQQSYEN